MHFRFAQILNKQIGWAVGSTWLHTWGRFRISSDTVIEVILVIYFNSNPALTPLQKRPFQLAKMQKNMRFLRWFLENFLGAQPPDPYTEEGPHFGGHLDGQVLRAPHYLNPALSRRNVESTLRTTMEEALRPMDNSAMKYFEHRTVSWTFHIRLL